MHILVTGAAGMLGRKLTERLVRDGGLNGRQIDKLTLQGFPCSLLFRTCRGGRG